MQIPQNAKTRSVTIAGESVTLPEPFAEGHTCTANEAQALNQVFAENVRNNLANQVKARADGEDPQSIVDSYIKTYEFGVRSGGGGRSADPVEREAMNIAREAVKAALAKKGRTDVKAKEISELAKQALEEKPDFHKRTYEQAKKIVKARESATTEELDL